MKNKLISAAILAVMMLSIVTVKAASVTPILVTNWESGNALDECEELHERGVCSCDCTCAYKFDNWDDFQYPHTFTMTGTCGNTITVESNDGKTFNWSSTLPICAVIVKAGTDANVYCYGCQSTITHDEGLEAPKDQQGMPRDISHVTFCWNTSPPDQIVPEVPLGTITAMVAMIAAFGAYFVLRKPKSVPL